MVASVWVKRSCDLRLALNFRLTLRRAECRPTNGLGEFRLPTSSSRRRAMELYGSPLTYTPEQLPFRREIINGIRSVSCRRIHGGRRTV
jgi:hypothetical protein